MLAKELKPGGIVLHNDAPHVVESVSVQSPSARGGATLYKFRARNLVTKQKADFHCKGTDAVDEADFQRRPVTLMYADGEHVHFLDAEDYNQYAIPQGDITVELKIVACDPGVKGNSATSRNKPAELETGLSIQVPEYLKQGETIKVDTRTGDFLGRA